MTFISFMIRNSIKRVPTKFAGIVLAATLLATHKSNSLCHLAIQVEKPREKKTTVVVQRTYSKVLSISQEFLSRLLKQILEFSNILWRAFTLGFIYSPAMISLPLLMYKPEYWWDVFRYCICQSGPCYTKAAQWVSTRPDLFSAEICGHLKKVQHNATNLDWSKIKPILVQHFGKNWGEKIQLDYDDNGNERGDQNHCHGRAPTMIGSGCVAQVFKGVLLDGSEAPPKVAIKVIHPAVRRTIKIDLKCMTLVAAVLERTFPGIKSISLSDSVEEFQVLMTQQLDMVREGQNLERFSLNFSTGSNTVRGKQSDSLGDRLWAMVPSFLQDKDQRKDGNLSVVFPTPIWELTSSEVLVETLQEGMLLTQWLELTRDNDRHGALHNTRKEVARIGLETVFQMIFKDNFIHADLHPGNIILLSPAPRTSSQAGVYENSGKGEHLSTKDKGSSAPSLAIIDAGLSVALSPTDQQNFVDLFRAMISNDGKKVGRLMINRSSKKDSVLAADKFIDQMGALVSDLHGQGLSLGRVDVGRLLGKVLLLCYTHQVKLEPRFVSVVVAMGVVEGLGRQLDPNVDLLHSVAPFVMRAAAARTNDVRRQGEEEGAAA